MNAISREGLIDRLCALNTWSGSDPTDASRLAVALQELALGEKLRHEVAENGVDVPARRPELVRGGLQHRAVRNRVRHRCKRAEETKDRFLKAETEETLRARDDESVGCCGLRPGLIVTQAGNWIAPGFSVGGLNDIASQQPGFYLFLYLSFFF